MNIQQVIKALEISRAGETTTILSSELSVILLDYISSIESSRDAWKKLAEELGDVITKDDGVCCGLFVYGVGNAGLHIPDCPIEQLRKLKEVEG